MAVSNLQVNLIGNANSLVSAVTNAGGVLGGLGAAVGVGAAALVGFGVASVNAAAGFQQGLTSLSTGAGELQSNLKMIGDGILSLSTSTGTSTQQLIDGMYMIESAGYHGSQALDILKAAAMGAKVGNADLGTVANGVTTMLNDYGNTGLTAAQATNTLIATVASGKTHMQDLSAAMASILPTAAASHVSLTDVSGALATMTAEGTPAADASTYLRQTIMSLEAPSKQSSSALESIGLSSQQVSSEMQKSLPGALQMMTDHLKKKFPEGSAAYVNALKDIAGGSKQMQGMLELTGQHLDTFKKNVEGIGDAVKKGGNGIQGWDQVSANFNQKLSQMQQGLNALAIKIGTALLPFLSGLLDKINPIIKSFGDWLTKGNGLQNSINAVGDAVAPLGKAIGDLGTALAPIIQQVIDWAKKNDILGNGGNALKGIIAAVAAGIEAAIPTIKSIALAVVQFAEDIVNRVRPIIEEFMVFWDQYWPAIRDILAGVWNEIKGIIEIAWAIISGTLKIALDVFAGNWGQAWNDFKDMLEGVWNGILDFIKGDIDILIGLINGFILGLDKMQINIPGVINFQPNIPTIPMLAGGTSNFAGGLAIVGENGPELVRLPGGSAVYPNIGLGGSSSSGNSSNMTVVLQIDSQEMSRVLVPGVAAGLQRTIYLRTGVR